MQATMPVKDRHSLALLKILLGVALSLPLSARAERTILLPPFELYTVHGGLRESATPGLFLGCTTADLIPGTINPPFEDGVARAQQTVNLSLSNLSKITQTVNLIVRGNGTKIQSANSNGNASTVPNTVGPNLALSDWTSTDIAIPALSSTTLVLVAGCNNANCQLIAKMDPAGSFTTVAGSGAFPDLSDLSNSCPGIKQVCLSQTSNFLLALKVHEDRGALSGHVTTAAHRCTGLKDHFAAPPVNLTINGGRPF